MRPLTVVCDLDAIVVNHLPGWLEHYNKTWGDNVTVHDLKTYEITDVVKPECGWKIYDIFHEQPEWYDTLPPIEGAVDAIRCFLEHGHDVVISTAVAGRTAGQKFTWCKKNLPFLNKRNIMVGARKELIQGDVFIDDAPKNLLAYGQRWPQAKLFTIEYPYNANLSLPNLFTARGYMDTRAAWAAISYHVGALSMS